VSRDVLLGRTGLSWCRGALEFADVAAPQKFSRLARETVEEVERAYREVARLSASGKVSTAERKAFRRVLEAKQELFRPDRTLTLDDRVEVENLRDACRRYAAKVLAPAAAAKAPPPAPPSAPPPRAGGGGEISLWSVVAAGAVVGVYYAFNKPRRRT